MTDSDYGILLNKDAALFGEVTNMGIPEILTEAVEKTNHSSGGVREFIPSKLKEIAEFTVTVNLTQTVLDDVNDDIDGGTISTWHVQYPADLGLNDFFFSGFPLSIAVQDADAQSPGVLMADVTLRPTGAVTISGAF